MGYDQLSRFVFTLSQYLEQVIINNYYKEVLFDE